MSERLHIAQSTRAPLTRPTQHTDLTYDQSHTNRSISQIVLKLAGRCNLNCSYCYVYNAQDKGYLSRPKFISEEVYEAVLARINEYSACRPGHSMSIGFHGGEPTLIGLPRFRRLAERARKILGSNLRGLAIQTNGTLINNHWADAIAELGVVASISLDGPANIHDATRIDHIGRGSHSAAVKGIEALQRAGLSPNVLCVVNPRHSGAAVYRYLRSLNISSMSFLLPDVSHDTFDLMYGDLGRTAVANYLVEALDAWAEEDDPDVVVHIFEDLLRRLLGGQGNCDSFGNSGSSYVIVETDGAIEGNDVFRVCEHGLSKTGLNVLENGFDDLSTGSPLIYQAATGAIPLAQACKACPERDICGGGYLPHRYSRAAGFDNPSVWCADIKRLLARLREYL
jgi:uncharacterized protein